MIPLSDQEARVPITAVADGSLLTRPSHLADTAQSERLPRPSPQQRLPGTPHSHLCRLGGDTSTWCGRSELYSHQIKSPSSMRLGSRAQEVPADDVPGLSLPFSTRPAAPRWGQGTAGVGRRGPHVGSAITPCFVLPGLRVSVGWYESGVVDLVSQEPSGARPQSCRKLNLEIRYQGWQRA